MGAVSSAAHLRSQLTSLTLLRIQISEFDGEVKGVSRSGISGPKQPRQQASLKDKFGAIAVNHVSLGINERFLSGAVNCSQLAEICLFPYLHSRLSILKFSKTMKSARLGASANCRSGLEQALQHPGDWSAARTHGAAALCAVQQAIALGLS